MIRRSRRHIGLVLAVVVGATGFWPPTGPQPTAAGEPPSSAEDQAMAAVERFVVRWRTGSYDRMHELLHATDRARYTTDGFGRQLEAFADAIGLLGLEAELGTVRVTTHAPEPRPADLPAPSGPPAVNARGVVEGPVHALEVDLSFTFQTTVFGELVLHRTMQLTQDADGWAPRWTPELLFPALGPTGGRFRVDEGPLPTRGRIIAADGSVLALTRADGKRVYPQESLAGQTVGYATPLTAEEAATRAAPDRYQAGHLAGRSGVEAGAEALLRGRTARALVAEPFGGAPVRVLDRRAVPGADVRLTIQPDLQRTAENALAGYAEAAMAAVDPATGDVWVLASAPAFNPNAMTIGTTYAGAPIARPIARQIRNHALESAYPTGSSFKPFALAAAFQSGAATPGTRMSCQPTWTFGGVRFVNYQLHQLPGLVSLAEAMAFSCNTTYMPLSMRIWERDRNALPAVVAEFGYGQPTGIGWLPESGGRLPDRLWYESHPRASGRYVSYNTFDQIQLSIGQGDFLGTQIQQAMAYAAFANRGTLWEPRLVTSAITPDGTPLLATEPEVRRQIDMAVGDLEYVVTSLRAVTTYSYGTGTPAFGGFGVPVAGKSGTAETGGPDPHALFAAFAPVASPEIVVATILTRVHLGTGGSHSAPLIRRVMATYFGR